MANSLINERAADTKSSCTASIIKSNNIIKHIPKLELLDQIVKKIDKFKLVNFDQTIFVGVQHILNTTASLFQSLLHLGAHPKKMYFAGKCYSTCPTVAKTIRKLGIHLIPDEIPKKPGEYLQACKNKIKKMWTAVLKNLQSVNSDVDTIIIIDEGGHCLEEMPYELRFKYKVAAIEQTRGGLYSNTIENLPFPLINVASSAVKKLIESPLIADSVYTKIEEYLTNLNLPPNTVWGVIGKGAVGNSIIELLLNNNMIVLVYDQDKHTFKNSINKKLLFRLQNIESIIVNAGYIIGCTGQDITKNIDVLNLTKKDKVFINCASEDREFLTLLKTISKHQCNPLLNPLSTINYSNAHHNTISILRGGFPINFNNSPESIPAKKIQITRALLLGACIQACIFAQQPIGDGETINHHLHLILDPYLQRFIMNSWDKIQQKSHNNFKHIDWIINNSGGNYNYSKKLKMILIHNQTSSLMILIAPRQNGLVVHKDLPG